MEGVHYIESSLPRDIICFIKKVSREVESNGDVKQTSPVEVRGGGRGEGEGVRGRVGMGSGGWDEGKG